MEGMEISLECAGENVMEETRFLVIGKIVADKILNRRGVMAILRGLWTDEVVYGVDAQFCPGYCVYFHFGSRAYL